MLIVGLTGSIAMGKTALAQAFRRRRVPVHDSDAAVHALLAPGGEGFAAVAHAFPQALRAGRIDRKLLGPIVFKDRVALRRLEGILHPLVRARADRFLAAAARRRAPVAVLDVPLLYETGAEQRCDAVVVASAPRFLQAARARRRGLDASRLGAVLANQVADADKRRRADFVVLTGLGLRENTRAAARILSILRERRGRRWCAGFSHRRPSRRPSRD